MEQQQLNILRVLTKNSLYIYGQNKPIIDGDQATISLDRLPYKDGKIYGSMQGASLLKTVNFLLDEGIIKSYQINNIETSLDGASIGGAYDIPGVKLYSGDLVLKGIDKKKLNQIGMDLAVATNDEGLKNIRNLMIALGVTSEPFFQNGILIVPDVSTEEDSLGRETAKRIVEEAEKQVKKLPKHMPSKQVIQRFINKDDSKFGIEVLTDSRDSFVIRNVTDEIIKPVLEDEIKKLCPAGFRVSLNKHRGGDDLVITIQPKPERETDTTKRLERLQLGEVSKKLSDLGIRNSFNTYDKRTPGAAHGEDETRANTPGDGTIMNQPHASLTIIASFSKFRAVCNLMKAELGKSFA